MEGNKSEDNMSNLEKIHSYLPESINISRVIIKGGKGARYSRYGEKTKEVPWGRDAGIVVETDHNGRGLEHTYYETKSFWRHVVEVWGLIRGRGIEMSRTHPFGEEQEW
jgi:hypothetical protein